MAWLDQLLTLNYVKISIPFFLLFIGLEAYLSWRRGLRRYRVGDTLNSLSCGILSQLMGVFVKASLVGCYSFVASRYGVWAFAEVGFVGKLATAIFLLFAVDFFYYWFHRFAHVVNIGWATHVVHHQSEDYNLATALRQGAFQDFISFAFYLPLALLGIPTAWFLALATLNTTYQFWIHTQAINKLPKFIELIFNTPSHHRVHHGQNTRYIDKNHAGMFIIWDRLFGTFQEEDEPAIYGITTPLASWNPLWAQTHYFADLAQQCRVLPGWRNKCKVWWQRPGWQPEPDSTPSPAVAHDRGRCVKFEAACCRSDLWLALSLFGLALLTAVTVLFAPGLPGLLRVLMVAASVFLLYLVGRVLEGRRFKVESRSTGLPRLE